MLQVPPSGAVFAGATLSGKSQLHPTDVGTSGRAANLPSRNVKMEVIKTHVFLAA
jgi:hypothetical protein